MAKVAYLTVATVLAGVLAMTLIGTNTAVAQSGCCMERDNPNSPWRIAGRDLDDCKTRNADLDSGDNILRPQGRIWWNTKC